MCVYVRFRCVASRLVLRVSQFGQDFDSTSLWVCVCESCESNINIKTRHLNSVRLSSASLFDAVSHMFVGTYFNMLTNGMMLIKRKFYS